MKQAAKFGMPIFQVIVQANEAKHCVSTFFVSASWKFFCDDSAYFLRDLIGPVDFS